MSNFPKTRKALSDLSKTLTHLVQRHPHAKYNLNYLWDGLAEANAELRDAEQPASPETVSTSPPIRVDFTNRDFELGHYDTAPRQVIDKLRSAGIPVIGDWMLRGVEYGVLLTTFRPGKGVVFLWHDFGEKPEADPFDELI